MQQLDTAELDRVRDRFRATRENTLDALRRIAVQLGADPAAPDVIDGLRRELHRVRGAAGSFGYGAVSDLAGAFEARALNWSSDPEFERGQREQILGRFISALDLLLSETPEDTGLRTTESPPAPLLLFVGSCELEEPLKAEAALRKMNLRSLSVVACSAAEIRAVGAHVLMATLPVDRAVSDAARLLNLPLVALEIRPLSDRGAEEESISGTVAVDITDGVGPAFEVASRLLERNTFTGATILAVDDDRSVLALMRAIFPGPEFDLQTLQDGSRLFETLAATEPSLLLLDVQMPTANGIDLLRRVRAHPTLRDLTVVLLSGAVDAATRDAAFAAGADEFIGKPIVVTELRARVADHLERRRSARLGAGLHPATGIALPERALRNGMDAVRELRERQRPTAVVVVRPRQEQHDSVSSAAWIRESARIDLALRDVQRTVGYGEAHDLVAVLNATTNHALARLSELAAAAPVGTPPWTAGVADVADITTGDYADARRAAGEAADAAVYDIGDAVHRWSPAESRLAPDVVLMEGDPPLLEMVQYALSSTGFTFEAFSDGLLGLEAMKGYDTLGRRPIVLLDVDLPGIDGHTLHGRLRLERPDDYLVVVMTAHGSETDELRALRAGAIDYIRKPINLRILMAKLTSWMQAARRPS